MSQQYVTTFTRQKFTKQANLHTHTTFIIAEIQTYTLLQLWRKVLELLKLYHGIKKMLITLLIHLQRLQSHHRSL